MKICSQRGLENRSFRLALVCVLGLLVAACGSVEHRNAVPEELVDDATPLGFENVRMFGDFNSPVFIEDMMVTRARKMKQRFADSAAAGETPHLKYLALSGGGQYGAFAAGILKGWSETGTRPVFEGVTGISTGSIIAPFAFLGSDYDDVLEEVYTTMSTKDVVEPRLVSGLLGGSSIANTNGLRSKISEYITEDLLASIAAEHRKGRLLLIGTTNLDLGRSVIWNMGAIAASGNPRSVELFRDVILASAAIPIAFPPVYFDVEADGDIYREMHVDGGVTSQVNILSPQIPSYLMEQLIGFDIDRSLFVIVNGEATPPPKTVQAKTLKIGAASVDALWYAQAVGDLYRIHTVAKRDRINVSYGWIPESFREKPKEQFDPDFMRKLFNLGQDLVRSGELWKDAPPFFTSRGSTAVERGERSLPRVDG